MALASRVPGLRVLAPIVLFAFSACGPGATPVDNTIRGVGLGGACDLERFCRSGLECVSGKCEAKGTTKNGEPCTIGLECESGVCGPRTTTGDGAKCQPAGSGTEGSTCGGDADCQKGLRCAFDGTGFFPRCVKAGSGDVGGDCTKHTDCVQGLVCTANKCTTPVVTPDAVGKGVPPYIPDPLTAWKGATCEPPKKGDVTALFVLPRPGEKAHEDFYRLPFPNDALRDKATGKISLANHPRDPKPPMGFDALKGYFDALESEPFGNYVTTYFRFDGEFDFSTVSVTEPKDDPQLRIVDLTAGPSFGQRLGINVFVTNGRNKYICENWVGVRPQMASPYLAGRTYGVIMKKGVKSCPSRDGSGKCSGGNDAKPHADFTAMLGASPPSDAALAGAYEAYKPLRDWLTKEKLTANDLLVATVFTVGNPARVAARLRTSVRTTTAPKAEGWVKCDSGVKSPCAQADEKEQRACGAASPDFDEYHATIELPIFQSGTAPYLTADAGGAIASSGGPTEPIAPVRTEKVCAALTVPKGTPPASGWPVVLYAHGTGGSFRSHVVDGAAKALSKVDVGGSTVSFAVLGIDQVQHGTRRGTSTLHPNDLFFNFANPAAARFNALQGAADQHALVRLAEGLTFSSGASTVKIDGTKILYWGHSQGATEGAIFLASDTTVKGAVFSGQGAALIDSLVTKTQPVNIKDAMWIALSESSPKAVDLWHPVLSLLQAWVEPADPLNYAAATVRVPGAGSAITPRNVFQVFGKDDTYSPLVPQTNFALAAGLAYVGPEIAPHDAFKGRSVPSVTGNVTVGAIKTTAAMREYAPVAGRDGHFVAYDVEQARTDLAKFLARVARGEVPKLPD